MFFNIEAKDSSVVEQETCSSHILGSRSNFLNKEREKEGIEEG